MGCLLQTRTLALVKVRHLFTKFTSDGLYCCLHTGSEPGTIRLYLAINKYTLERWSKHALKDPPPKDLNGQEPFEQRFSVDEGNKVRQWGFLVRIMTFIYLSSRRVAQTNSEGKQFEKDLFQGKMCIQACLDYLTWLCHYLTDPQRNSCRKTHLFTFCWSRASVDLANFNSPTAHFYYFICAFHRLKTFLKFLIRLTCMLCAQSPNI